MSGRGRTQATRAERSGVSEPVPVGSELVVFRAGDERFAIAVGAIERVIEMPPLTPLPVMPPAMLGVIELRGALLPIYSPAHVLRTVLETPKAALIARREGGRDSASRRIGIAIDGAEDVVVYDPDAWSGVGGPLPHSGLVRGVGTWQGHLTTLLDASLFIAACCASAAEEG